MNSTCTSCLSGLFYTSALGFETLPTPEKRPHLNEEHAWRPLKEYLPPSSPSPAFLIQYFIFLPSPSLTSVPGSATFLVLALFFSYFLFPLCILEIGWYERLHTRCNTWQNHSSAYMCCHHVDRAVWSSSLHKPDSSRVEKGLKIFKKKKKGNDLPHWVRADIYLCRSTAKGIQGKLCHCTYKVIT